MRKIWCPCSKRHWDLNPRPSERESPPITTRPGLPRPLLWQTGRPHLNASSPIHFFYPFFIPGKGMECFRDSFDIEVWQKQVCQYWRRLLLTPTTLSIKGLTSVVFLRTDIIKYFDKAWVEIKWVKSLISNLTNQHNPGRIGGRHSLVHSSAPTIQWSRVRIPSTPSTLFPFTIFIIVCRKVENKQKEAEFGPYFNPGSVNRPVGWEDVFHSGYQCDQMAR